MIGADMFGLIELLGVFGLLLGLLGWQWMSIRRTLRRDREEAERARTGGDASGGETIDR